MSSYQPTTAQLRPALQFALELARITPPAELPARVRPIARARRLPPNWAATMRLALEEDDEYRGDVAGEANEERLGEIPWLWLSRPEGWAERVGELVRAALEVDEREKEQTYLEGRIAALQRDLDAASSARDQLQMVGIPAGQIFMAELCTASHPDVLCSYRRDGSPYTLDLKGEELARIGDRQQMLDVESIHGSAGHRKR